MLAQFDAKVLIEGFFVELKLPSDLADKVNEHVTFLAGLCQSPQANDVENLEHLTLADAVAVLQDYLDSIEDLLLLRCRDGMLDHADGAIDLALLARPSVSQEDQKFLVGFSLLDIGLLTLLLALPDHMLDLLDVALVRTLPDGGQLLFDED